jgi:hypothetical protein
VTFAPPRGWGWSLLALLTACDPVVSDAISALPSQSGVRNGPLHRAGQPCLLCHDGDFGDPSAFSVAGTVFETSGAVVGADQAVVSMTDTAGKTYEATTNSAGNFYITPSQWSPTFPLTHVAVTGATGVIATMQSSVGRDGACASCHADPAGPTSPGHVALTNADGGLLP